MGKSLITAKFQKNAPLNCRVRFGAEHAIPMGGSVSSSGINQVVWDRLKESCNGTVTSELHGADLYKKLNYNAVSMAYVLMRRLAEKGGQKTVTDAISDLKEAIAMEKESSASQKVMSAAPVPALISRHCLNRFFVAVIQAGSLRLATMTEWITPRLDGIIQGMLMSSCFEKPRATAFLMGLSTNKKSGAVVCGDAEPEIAELQMLRSEKRGLLPIYEVLHAATSNPMFKIVGG